MVHITCFSGPGHWRWAILLPSQDGESPGSQVTLPFVQQSLHLLQHTRIPAKFSAKSFVAPPQILSDLSRCRWHQCRNLKQQLNCWLIYGICCLFLVQAVERCLQHVPRHNWSASGHNQARAQGGHARKKGNYAGSKTLPASINERETQKEMCCICMLCQIFDKLIYRSL